MGADEDKETRDRLKALEMRADFNDKRVDGLDKKIWGAIALVLAFVGNKILAVLNIGGG